MRSLLNRSLLEVNEALKDKRNAEVCFLVILYLSLASIDNIYPRHRQQCSNSVFPVERFAKTKTRCHCTDNRNERIEDGDLANRVTAEQFVIKCETKCGDAD